MAWRSSRTLTGACRVHPAEWAKRERMIHAESHGKADPDDHPGHRWWLCATHGWHPGAPPERDPCR